MTPDTQSPLPARLFRFGESAIGALEWLQPLALFAARLYVASVFFRAGLSKLRDWDSTLALFAAEYQVPLLNPSIAAFIGTGAELLLPLLLVAGLFGRFAAAGLSVLNGVAVLSLTDIPEAALQGHVFWGSLLALLLLWGPGALSFDRWMKPRLQAWAFGRSAPVDAGARRISRAA